MKPQPARSLEKDFLRSSEACSELVQQFCLCSFTVTCMTEQVCLPLSSSVTFDLTQTEICIISTWFVYCFLCYHSYITHGFRGWWSIPYRVPEERLKFSSKYLTPGYVRETTDGCISVKHYGFSAAFRVLFHIRSS